MISLAEPTAGFSTLSRQFKRLTQELMDELSLEPETVQFGAARKTIGTHMDPGKTYLVKSGMLNVICQTSTGQLKRICSALSRL